MSISLPVGVDPGTRGSGVHCTSLTDVETFEQFRPMLLSLAYRILGSAADAQDVVQETWLRLAGSVTEPDHPRAFLHTIATRISIDLLRSRRRGCENRPWELGLSEPALAESDPSRNPAASAELADAVSTAAMLLLERLTPLELAVFVLREVLEFGFDDIATVVGRSPGACRQLAVRARRHVNSGRARFVTDKRERRELADQLLAALTRGDVDDLCDSLTNRLHVDSGTGATSRAARAAAVA